MITEEQPDFATTEQWYRISVAIKEKQGNKHRAASSHGQLKQLAALQKHYEQTGQWFIKVHTVFYEADPHFAELSTRDFVRLCE